MDPKECRICFTDTNLVSLFKTIDGTRISEQVEKIGKVKISEDDNLPKYICTSCIGNVRACIEFQHQIEFSHKDFYEPPEAIIEVEIAENNCEEGPKTKNTKQKSCKENRKTKENTNQSSCEENLETVESAIQNDSEENLKIKEKGTQGNGGKNSETRNTTNPKSSIKSLNDKQQLDTEKVNPDKPHEFLCLACNYGCDSQEALTAHIREAHINNNRSRDSHKNNQALQSFECHVCNEKYSSAMLLREHKSIHKTLPCAYCTKAYSCKRSLNRHLRSHSYWDSQGRYITPYF